eukprot:2269031-Karenia_brevis.AAC.1
MFKSSILCQPPIQWRGGQIHELYKGKGPIDESPNYRDISLFESFGKVYAKDARVKFKPFLDAKALNTQSGSGVRRAGTDLAHLHLRALVGIANHPKMSVAILFIDVITAYASLVREVVFPDVDCESEL